MKQRYRCGSRLGLVMLWALGAISAAALPVNADTETVCKRIDAATNKVIGYGDCTQQAGDDTTRSQALSIDTEANLAETPQTEPAPPQAEGPAAGDETTAGAGDGEGARSDLGGVGAAQAAALPTLPPGVTPPGTGAPTAPGARLPPPAPTAPAAPTAPGAPTAPAAPVAPAPGPPVPPPIPPPVPFGGP